jgi:hypothetical protein
MQTCIPRKGDFLVLTEDIISTVGSQKLEFYSKKYPEFHPRRTSFVLKKGEWYQVGSIYVLKSSIYFNLRIQKTRSTRLWMKTRIDNELEKVASVYSPDEDEPVLRSRSVECFASDLHKRSLVFHHAYEALEAREAITKTLTEKSRRWEHLEIQ